MKKRYGINDEEKKQFAGLYILEYIINKPHNFAVFLSGGDQDLELILEWLLVKECIEIRHREFYAPTVKGREYLQNFMARYTEFLNIFDIYCAVDLEAGEFAFAHYFDYPDQSRWKAFLALQRWDDLRVAVCDYKGINPVEIVFMSFISEQRFGRDQTGWQFDLLLGTVWDEILEICNTAIPWQELGFEDEQGQIAAEDVIEDIIIQGAQVVVELHEREAHLAPEYFYSYNGASGDADGAVSKRIHVEHYPVDYYHSYLDPRYVSPVWRFH